MSNQPPSPSPEAWRLAAETAAHLEAAAQLLEDTKSAVLAQMIARLGDIPHNRAENMVKAGDEWMNHVTKIVEARKEANLARIHADYERMKIFEKHSQEANTRAEMRL